MKGPEHLDSDVRLGSAEVYASSEERWMLEVLEPARRGKDGESKGMSTKEVGSRLDAMIRAGGEERINSFRDRARIIAEEMGHEKEFDTLNTLISALLNTHTSAVLTLKKRSYKLVYLLVYLVVAGECAGTLLYL